MVHSLDSVLVVSGQLRVVVLQPMVCLLHIQWHHQPQVVSSRTNDHHHHGANAQLTLYDQPCADRQDQLGHGEREGGGERMGGFRR